MLNNKVFLISGGTGRLGSVFCEAIVKHNGKVLIVDASCPKKESIKKVIEKGNVYFVKRDVTDIDQIDEAIRITIEKFGRIDGAVHCAYPVSGQWGTRFEDLKSEFLYQDLANQLGGAILFSQRLIRQFRAQEYGCLIHIASIHGISTPKFWHYENTGMTSPIEYSAIKAGIISVTKYLAQYCANQNIRINSISPGGIADKQPKAFLERYRSSCHSKGMLDAGDVVGTLVFLLSDNSKYISGQNIVVDDGWSV